MPNVEQHGRWTPELGWHNVPVATEATTFRALCETCPWEGPDRTSSLTALRDYDRHLETADHVYKTLAATAAADSDEEDPDGA